MLRKKEATDEKCFVDLQESDGKSRTFLGGGLFGYRRGQGGMDKCRLTGSRRRRLRFLHNMVTAGKR